jgi:two-component system cell cycle sensor histidine kinase/response regulator CckA
MNEKPTQVLLVEDDLEYSHMIQELLTIVWDAPLDLEHANLLSTGLDRLAAGTIDVILLDLSLPDSWGFDTFTRMHAQAPGVPIIVLSGLADETLAVKVMREGAQAFLVKGQADGSVLIRAIRHALET